MRGVAALLAVAVAMVARGAAAQQAPLPFLPSWGGPALGPPRVTTFPSVGDANGTAGGFGVPSFALDPLRLALYGDAPPIGRTFPGCENSLEAAGSATAASPGYASQHATAMRLVPHLTLAGFARGGCAVDAALGGGLVYATPLAPKVWLVLAAGILHLPHYDKNATPTNTTQLRGDVVFDRGGGRSISVGIGQNRGGPMLHVGGVL